MEGVLELLQAQQAIVAGLYNDAISILESASHLSELAEYWHLKGIAYLMRGDYYRAKENLEKALSISKEDPRIKLDLAITRWNLGEEDSVLQILEELTDKLPYIPVIYMTLLWLSGDLERLEEYLEKLLHRSRNYNRTVLGYANYFSALLSLYYGDLKEAYRKSFLAYKSLPKFRGSKILVTILLIKAKKLLEAEKILSELKGEERNEKVWSYLYGLAKLLEGDVESARPLLEKALHECPEKATIWYSLGVAYLIVRNIAKAQIYFKGAFVLDNENSDFRNAFATTIAMEGNIKKAIRLLERGDTQLYPSYIKDNLHRLKKAAR